MKSPDLGRRRPGLLTDGGDTGLRGNSVQSHSILFERRGM